MKRKIFIVLIMLLSCFTLVACGGTNYPGNTKSKYWLSEDNTMMFYFPAEAGRGNAAGHYLVDEETIEDIILEWNAKTGVVEVMTAGYEKMFTANTVTDSKNLICIFEITSLEEGYNFPAEIIFHWKETINFSCINNIHTWSDKLVKDPNNGGFCYQCTICGKISEPEHIDIGYACAVTVTRGADFLIDDITGVYSAGIMLEFYAYPIMDADLAMYVNGEFYQTQDTVKIDGEYRWRYSLLLPYEDIDIEFKVISIEYSDVRNILDIPELSLDDIVEVRYERGYIGVAPGSLTNILYSTDMEDKDMALSLLEMPVYEDVTDNWQVDGGGYILYSIFTNNERYDIKISNGYIWVNQKHYKFIGEYVLFEYPCLEAHSYVTYQDTFEAYTMDGIKIGDFDGLSKFEFIEYPYDVVPENENAGYLETEIGRLYILNEEIFYIKNGNTHTYFLVVGEKNFKDIFQK